MDVVRKAALQLTVADFNPDVLIMNPIDFDTAVGTKTATTNDYVWANPAFNPRGQIWGLIPIVSNSMTSGQFLVLDSRTACCIFDRMAATVEISLDHSDYRVRNMGAIIVEEIEREKIPSIFLDLWVQDGIKRYVRDGLSPAVNRRVVGSSPT